MRQLAFRFVKQLPDGSAAIETVKIITLNGTNTLDRDALVDEFNKFLGTLMVDGDVTVTPKITALLEKPSE